MKKNNGRECYYGGFYQVYYYEWMHCYMDNSNYNDGFQFIRTGKNPAEDKQKTNGERKYFSGVFTDLHLEWNYPFIDYNKYGNCHIRNNKNPTGA